ncbi:proline dehydrogenase family protein [Metabacillus halosaccharovorans]|uniref:proline dehydrogenase family protein n=1 Tax=Metabacillus halosaccharovorans TaxID=930124 RepID=UPI00203CDF7E|nr:proline dehydrogenase [Metabacillus halosaccharovorans]MCM3440000.1 proline dehydrogenase [Metabacillus halosaccharovorans]
MEKLLRNSFMFLSRNKMMTKLAKKYGLRFGAARFVAGNTIDGAKDVIKQLNNKGLDVTLDYLGEFIIDENEAEETANHCIKAIEIIGHERLKSQVSIKLTSMGLDISEEVVLSNMCRILAKAKKHGVFITIDMEDYSRCEKTLKIFKHLRSEYDNVGTVLQAYLYRTVDDVEDLGTYQANLRLVKGAYKESADVAFPDKKDVDLNFKKIIKMHLLNGHYTAIATHDDQIIDYTKQIVNKHGIPKTQFEFQMLYGIRPEKQLEIVNEGYKMRVYVPYGTDWYGYFMRRMAERPANVAFVIRGMIKR